MDQRITSECCDAINTFIKTVVRTDRHAGSILVSYYNQLRQSQSVHTVLLQSKLPLLHRALIAFAIEMHMRRQLRSDPIFIPLNIVLIQLLSEDEYAQAYSLINTDLRKRLEEISIKDVLGVKMN